LTIDFHNNFPYEKTASLGERVRERERERGRVYIYIYSPSLPLSLPHSLSQTGCFLIGKIIMKINGQPVSITMKFGFTTIAISSRR